MISLIEALNYRCLRYIRQPLGAFHVLVGPNASGKTSFLDVVAFLHDLVSKGLDAASGLRTSNFSDLVWQHEGDRFELAVEARIPEARRDQLEEPEFDTIRYEIAIELDGESQEIGIVEERAFLKNAPPDESEQKTLFPVPSHVPKTIFTSDGQDNTRTVLARSRSGEVSCFNENPGRKPELQADDILLVNGAPSHFDTYRFALGPKLSALAHLPGGEENFPVGTWLKQLISSGVEQVVLESLPMRRASPPGQGFGFKPDGSNLPWVIANLERKSPERIKEWINHLRTALPDLVGIQTVEREDDRHRYLRLIYEGGLKVPSWMASDGTLRLLALTLPAYLDELTGVYLIEEPENGIHPMAIETMYQSLSNVPDAQVLLATHSPVILAASSLDDVLCFAKNDDGATDIVVGRKNPRLADWQGETDLGTLFASGVLG